MDLINVILSLLNVLKVADAFVISDYLIKTGKVKWQPGHSARVQVDKLLRPHVLTGKIEKCRGYYRVDSKSTYQPHSKLITQTILNILTAYPQSIVKREVEVPCGLRSDIIALIVTKGGDAICVIIEVILQETPEYLESKLNKWNSYEDALPFLRELFHQPQIPCYTFVKHTELLTFLTEEICEL